MVHSTVAWPHLPLIQADTAQETDTEDDDTQTQFNEKTPECVSVTVNSKDWHKIITTSRASRNLLLQVCDQTSLSIICFLDPRKNSKLDLREGYIHYSLNHIHQM